VSVIFAYTAITLEMFGFLLMSLLSSLRAAGATAACYVVVIMTIMSHLDEPACRLFQPAARVVLGVETACRIDVQASHMQHYGTEERGQSFVEVAA